MEANAAYCARGTADCVHVARSCLALDCSRAGHSPVALASDGNRTSSPVCSHGPSLKPFGELPLGAATGARENAGTYPRQVRVSHEQIAPPKVPEKPARRQRRQGTVQHHKKIGARSARALLLTVLRSCDGKKNE